MPRKLDLFLAISKLPPDDLEALCRKIQEAKPRSAAIMADVLRPTGERPRPAPASEPVPVKALRLQAEAQPSGFLRSVSRGEAEAAASGQPPPGYELPPEALADQDP